MTQSDDHGTLPAHAEQLVARVEQLERLSVHGASMHTEHADHAKRARYLAGHLRAILLLIEGRHYPTALVVVRAAVEHHLMDRLIFLANRHVETYGGVGKGDVAAEEVRLAELQKTRPDLERWWWDDSGMNVVWRGYHSNRSKKGHGRTISPYYFLADQFDPFTGGKKHAAKLASPFWKNAHRQEWAAEAAAAWRRYFVHDKVLKALNVNRLLPGRLGVQIDEHYSFLSGFVHPTNRGYEAIYGSNWPNRMGSFDHYASEILLLYVITIAAAELEIYARMARRQPKLGLAHWDVVEAEFRDARLASSYFWFLGGEPTMLDRIDTVHTPPGESEPKWGRPRRDPRTIRDQSVQYYADPLRRLVRLHQSWQELSTGIAFTSPFPRADAISRH